MYTAYTLTGNTKRKYKRTFVRLLTGEHIEILKETRVQWYRNTG